MSRHCFANITGVNHMVLSRIENGKARLASKHIAAVCKEIGITPNELFGWPSETSQEAKRFAAFEFVRDLLDKEIRAKRC